MSHWPYIVIAYVLTLGGMAALTLHAWLRMRKAEGQADQFGRSSRAKSRGVVTDSKQSPLDFAQDEREIPSTAR